MPLALVAANAVPPSYGLPSSLQQQPTNLAHMQVGPESLLPAPGPNGLDAGPAPPPRALLLTREECARLVNVARMSAHFWQGVPVTRGQSDHSRPRSSACSIIHRDKHALAPEPVSLLPGPGPNGLDAGPAPPHRVLLTRKERARLVTFARTYCLYNGLVYRRPGRHAARTRSLSALQQAELSHDHFVLFLPSAPGGLDPPELLQLKHKIMAYCHGGLMSMHAGVHATFAHCSQRFHWRGMFDDVTRFVNGCLHCAVAKTSGKPRFGYRQSFERTGPMDTVCLDILTFKGAASRGARGEQHILVMYDLFTHFLLAQPLRSRAVEEVGETVIQHLFLVHGAPRRFVVDNEFNNTLFAEVLAFLRSKVNFTSPYHSQGNPAERAVRRVEELLRVAVHARAPEASSSSEVELSNIHHGQFAHWTRYLQYVVLAHNVTPFLRSRVCNISPYQLIFGRAFRWPADTATIRDPGRLPVPTSIRQYYETKSTHLRALFKVVHAFHREAAAKSQEIYNVNMDYLELLPQDLVLVHTPTRLGKLAPRYAGPYKVLRRDTAPDGRRESHLVYILQHCHSDRIIKAHVNRIRRFHGGDSASQDLRHSPRGRPPTSAQPGRALASAPAARRVHDPQPGQGDRSDLPSPAPHHRRSSSALHAATRSPEETAFGHPDAASALRREQHAPMRPDTFVLFQVSDQGDRIHVAKVLEVFLDTEEINVHFYIHQTTTVKRKKVYDINLPLAVRQLSPEYSYRTKSGSRWMSLGTYKPKPFMSPYHQTFRLDDLRILVRNFQLSPVAHGAAPLPADVLLLARDRGVPPALLTLDVDAL
eukprot:CAMPEP_0118998380 /NCGR_PEP_ID=MMETSP1173-20130426/63042_1 /TAXON_ID=1034831 /ORGANISM="Rhizochromulina marina cf, Strain CCMP1243" /LENGTH=818 /DNA_ID=CAMNT_0006949871 /DNA_START=1140 /DNA_END=3596 /DNA_ORIENTATION=+